MKFAKFVDPITGVVTKLPIELTKDQQKAICAMIANKGDLFKPTDRLAAIRLYRELTGEATATGEGGVTTLKVVVEGAK